MSFFRMKARRIKTDHYTGGIAIYVREKLSARAMEIATTLTSVIWLGLFQFCESNSLTVPDGSLRLDAGGNVAYIGRNGHNTIYSGVISYDLLHDILDFNGGEAISSTTTRTH
jgi:hypothetical protein